MPYRHLRRGDTEVKRVSGWMQAPKKILPRTPLRIVVCPTCQAAVGAPCISTTGRTKEEAHVARRRMAFRAMQAQRES